MGLSSGASFEERKTVVVDMATTYNDGLRGCCENPVSGTSGS